MANYIVAAIEDWNKLYFDELSINQKGSWHFSSTPVELVKLLKALTPKYIFFCHWHWIVPKEIVNRFECVCFHMTDLPFGRGGSPLQNLIVRGHKETMLTALRMEEGVDTGPIYFKKPLSLKGSADEIYNRASALSCDMIADFVKDRPSPVPQCGDVVNFNRRTPDLSLIPLGLSLEKVYDYIRMLDAPGYPKAFIETKEYRLEFDNAEYIGDKLTAKVSFIKKED